MDDKLKQQIEQLLEKAERPNEPRVIEFFERIAGVELPVKEDRYWLLEQFNTLVEAFTESEKDKQTRSVLIMTGIFTMGRVWERYYAQGRVPADDLIKTEQPALFDF